MTEIIHACPPDGEYLTPCCGHTPFELPLTDRMTMDPSLVDCQGAEALVRVSGAPGKGAGQ